MNTNPSLRPLATRNLRQARSKGSVLIVSMILCAVIGISLASYLQLGRTGLVISNRALYNNAAMNLAENGLEEAMYAINKTVANSSYNWASNGWTTTSPLPAGDARRRLPASGTYTFDQGVTGTVRVYVFGYAGTAPRALARSTINMGSGRTLEKWVEIRMRKTSKFANGLVAKDSIRFSGNNASVDSWHSKKNDDGTPRGSPVPYSSAVDHDKGSVGSISVSVNAVLVQNADIWGYAATGGAVPSVGSNGVVGPYGTPSGTMDMSRVSTDFSASFDPVSPPTTAGYTDIANITANTILPRAADVAASDGKYYYTTGQINFNNKYLTEEDRGVSRCASRDHPDQHLNFHRHRRWQRSAQYRSGFATRNLRPGRHNDRRTRHYERRDHRGHRQSARETADLGYKDLWRAKYSDRRQWCPQRRRVCPAGLGQNQRQRRRLRVDRGE
jgi:hypothetical protein